jgi:hypothetical protein
MGIMSYGLREKLSDVPEHNPHVPASNCNCLPDTQLPERVQVPPLHVALGVPVKKELQVAVQAPPEGVP